MRNLLLLCDTVTMAFLSCEASVDEGIMDVNDFGVLPDLPDAAGAFLIPIVHK